MTDITLTRRRLLTLAGATALAHRPIAAVSLTQPPSLTVQDVMARVQQRLGGTPPTPPATTVDGLKAGRPDQRVTGIVTTALATTEVIRRAAAARHNLVITYEPTFFARADQRSPANRATDAVFAAKRTLIDEREIAVWRLHDQWLARQPDPMVQGFAEALQWTPYQAAGQPHHVTVPAIALRELVDQIQTRLGARALRVVGNPDLRVTRVLLSPGPSAPATTFTGLARTDVVLAGEPREWEGVEYVQDAIAAGQQKAMVIVGRILSEDCGMKLMARWLSDVLPEVPIAPMPAGDPYWRPAAR